MKTALEQAPKQQQTGHRCPAALAELHADVPIPSRKRAADGGQVGSRLETSPQRCGNHGKVATAMGGASPRQMVPTSTPGITESPNISLQFSELRRAASPLA